jgi:integrase
MPDLRPDSAAFLAAYAALSGGKDLPKAPQPRSGSIAVGIAAFLASATYLSKSAATRAVWRRGLDDMRTRYGTAMLADLQQVHIRKDLARLQPHPAVMRLKIWRAACQWWQENGLTKGNAAEGIKRPKVPKSNGHTPWTADDLAAFRAYWPNDSRERFAFEWLHWTGQRISDAVVATEAQIDRDGWFTFRQTKTGGQVSVPIRAPAPAFSDPAGQTHMLAALDARPDRHLVLMVTAFGKPRSVKAASSWLAAAARKAGIMGKSAHGLRKTRAMTMAERGATTHQMAAWIGHESLGEVARYSRNADKKRIISGPDQEQKVPTERDIVGTIAENTSKSIA